MNERNSGRGYRLSSEQTPRLSGQVGWWLAGAK